MGWPMSSAADVFTALMRYEAAGWKVLMNLDAFPQMSSLLNKLGALRMERKDSPLVDV